MSNKKIRMVQDYLKERFGLGDKEKDSSKSEKYKGFAKSISSGLRKLKQRKRDG